MAKQNVPRTGFAPIINQAIFELRPDFRLVSINVSGFSWSNAKIPEISAFINEAERSTLASDRDRDAHLQAWSDAYRAFGAEPNRTLCSAAALFKRTSRDAALPRINTLVDIYNAVSVMHGLPVGGEDRTQYEGVPRLTRSDGSERFETMKNGELHIEHPVPGEVIWRDDLGVTCRRWNWRQGVRTQIKQGASDLWFVLEALDGLPESRFKKAVDQMVQSINLLSPAAHVEIAHIDHMQIEQIEPNLVRSQ